MKIRKQRDNKETNKKNNTMKIKKTGIIKSRLHKWEKKQNNMDSSNDKLRKFQKE